MFKIFKKKITEFIGYNYYIFFLFIVSIYILAIPNMWDSADFDHAFSTNHLQIINIWAIENSSPIQLIPIYFLYILKKIVGVPHELLFDIFTIITYILFCLEIKKLCRQLLNLKKYWCNISVIFASIFPVWESLVSIHLGLYLFFFYLALVGHRFFLENSYPKKIFGIVLILLSFTIKSNLSFVIGLSAAYHLKNVFINNKKENTFVYILLLSISCFLLNKFFFSPYNFFNKHNEIIIENINFKDLFINFLDFLSFFLTYSWILFIFLLKKININKKEIINLICIALIFFSSVIPYLAINKSTDIFYFKDFSSRHAFLVAVSFSLFFTLIFEIISKIITKKIILLLIYLFIFESLFISSIKYYFKIEAAIFRNYFINQLKEIDKPSSGFIKFKSEDNNQYFTSAEIESYFPGHRLRNSEISSIFYKAYNEEAWLLFIPSAKDEKVVDFEKYKIFFKAKDFNYKNPCTIEVTFKNNLDFINRIKKFYIFNYKKYYLIKSIQERC